MCYSSLISYVGNLVAVQVGHPQDAYYGHLRENVIDGQRLVLNPLVATLYYRWKRNGNCIVYSRVCWDEFPDIKLFI